MLMEDKIRAMLTGLDDQRGSLIPLLQAIQSEFGYIPRAAVKAVSEVLSISESHVYGVATFYSEFRLVQPGEHHIKVCMGTSCYLKGGRAILDKFSRRLGIRPGSTSPDARYSLETVACLGCCSRSPVVVADDQVHSNLGLSSVDEIISSIEGSR
jgi:NADH-quinone oxidoreductase subunit E